MENMEIQMKHGFWCLEPELPGVLYVFKNQAIRLLWAFPQYPDSISWLNRVSQVAKNFVSTTSSF